MSLASDPLDEAFPGAAPSTAALAGDPLDAAFPDEKRPNSVIGKNGEVTSGPLGFINGLAEAGGNLLFNIPANAAHGAVDLYRRVSGGDPTAPEPSGVTRLRVPLSQNAQNVEDAVGSLAGTKPTVADQIDALRRARLGTPNATVQDIVNQTAGVAGDVASIAPLAVPVRGVAGAVRAAAEGPAPAAAAETARAAQEIINKSTAGQSMGAASATHDVEAISPELQQAVVEAARKTGGAVNPEVLKNHIEAEEHGVQLMRGQATRDPQQFTEEQNSTHPDVTARLNVQNAQMTDALDTIRRNAAPSTVGNDYIENGRAAVDALKQYDEPIKADIKAKYQQLADANGGSLPIDTSKVMDEIQPQLDKHFLNKTAQGDSSVSEVLDALRSGDPMSMESFENARTGLAAVQRGGGREAVAAGIVRNALENMPLTGDAANLKGLADSARSAAKARFQALEADPAYKAAVDDVGAGNERGSPSPLADTFLDKYALSKSAPQSEVDLMMQKIKATDPDAAGAVASHALNAVRKAAISPNGSVLPNGYNGALQKLGPKLDSLIEPETKDSLESLGRVITNAKVEPAGGKVNYSRSGVIAREAIQSAVEHAANAKTGGVYGIAKKMLNTSENAFARDALKPGAGLEQLTTKP